MKFENSYSSVPILRDALPPEIKVIAGVEMVRPSGWTVNLIVPKSVSAFQSPTRMTGFGVGVDVGVGVGVGPNNCPGWQAAASKTKVDKINTEHFLRKENIFLSLKLVTVIPVYMDSHRLYSQLVALYMGAGLDQMKLIFTESSQ